MASLLRLAAGVLLAALPWLNPFSSGPSPAAEPWLVSCVSVLLLCLLAQASSPLARPGLLALAVALTLWVGLSQASVKPETVMLAGGLALIVLSAGLVDDPDFAQALQAGLLLAACLSAVIALLQYFGLAGSLRPWISFAQAGEAYANLRQPNHFCSLCWIGTAVLLFGTLRLPRPAVFALMLLLTVASAASVSRTGMLQGFALTVLAVAWNGPRRWERLALCIGAAVAYFAAAWLLPQLLAAATGALPARTLWDRMGGGESCSSRLVLWSNVLHLIARKPLAGWGWGELDYAHYLTPYPAERFCDILDNAHNLPLHLAVELGLPAALLACGAVVWWALRARPWAEARPQRQLAWCVLAVLGIHSLLEYPLWYGPFQIALGLALGLLACPGEAAQALAVRTRAAVALAGLGLVGYAAWDYERVSQIYLEPDQRRAVWRENTLDAVRKSWLFSGQARFAELTLSSLGRSNLAWTDATAQAMLHYSPEPRVIERVIASATMAGRYDDAVLHLARYRAAFPEDYAKWRAAQKAPLPALDAR